MQDTFFRANEWQYLGLGIEIDIIPTLIETTHGLAKFWRALCRLIAVGIGLTGYLAELFYRLL